MVGPQETVNRLRESIPPWSVNNLAQAAARAALDDREYRRRSVNFMRQERTRFGRLLRRLPGNSNLSLAGKFSVTRGCLPDVLPCVLLHGVGIKGFL